MRGILAKLTKLSFRITLNIKTHFIFIIILIIITITIVIIIIIVFIHIIVTAIIMIIILSRSPQIPQPFSKSGQWKVYEANAHTNLFLMPCTAGQSSEALCTSVMMKEGL